MRIHDRAASARSSTGPDGALLLPISFRAGRVIKLVVAAAPTAFLLPESFEAGSNSVLIYTYDSEAPVTFRCPPKPRVKVQAQDSCTLEPVMGVRFRVFARRARAVTFIPEGEEEAEAAAARAAAKLEAAGGDNAPPHVVRKLFGTTVEVGGGTGGGSSFLAAPRVYLTTGFSPLSGDGDPASLGDVGQAASWPLSGGGQANLGDAIVGRGASSPRSSRFAGDAESPMEEPSIDAGSIDEFRPRSSDGGGGGSGLEGGGDAGGVVRGTAGSPAGAFLTKHGQVFMDGATVLAASGGGGDGSSRLSPRPAGRSASVTWKDEAGTGRQQAPGSGGRVGDGEAGAGSGSKRKQGLGSSKGGGVVDNGVEVGAEGGGGGDGGGSGSGSVLNARALELVSGMESPPPGARGPMRRRVEEVGSWAKGDATDAAASAQQQQQQEQQKQDQQAAPIQSVASTLAVPTLIASAAAGAAAAATRTSGSSSPRRTPRGGGAASGGGGGLAYEPTEIFSQHSGLEAAPSDLCAVDDAAMCRVPAPEEAADPCTPAATLPRLPVLEVGPSVQGAFPQWEHPRFPGCP